MLPCLVYLLIMSALYIHIPFCLSKCFYCSFCSFAGRQELHADYVGALQKELTALSSRQAAVKLDTLFIGGGTPTCLDSLLLCSLLDHCFELFSFSKGAEVSVETNPGTVDSTYLKKLRQNGVNRLSIGVQSFQDRELEILGRPHGAWQALQTLELAKTAGFTNINIDLMYGIPGQSAISWRASLEEAVRVAPQHLSLYQMSVESGTKMEVLVNSNQRTLPDEEEIAEMDRATAELCNTYRYGQYEVSNYCRPGYRCRHNLTYWYNEDYYGVGASAVDYSEGIRSKRIADLAAYIEAVKEGRNFIVEHEQLSQEETFRETVIMGLRLTEGVSRETLQTRFGINPVEYYGDTLKKLLDQEVVEMTPTKLRITSKGQPFSNQIMADLV